MPRVFLKEELIIGNEIKITDKIFHYLKNVMRCNINDEIILVNGKDGEFLSKITFENNKYLILKNIKKTKNYQQLPFLGLIFAPIQKIDLLLKSSTELGVTEFLPIITEYTNKSNIKLNKIDGNIIEAIEQSERLDFPVIHQIDKLSTVLDKLNNEQNIIFFCEERTGQNLPINVFNNINVKDKNIYALVGPEGGFSKQEKELINSYNNTISISLGNTILRTETATINILSILKAFFY